MLLYASGTALLMFLLNNLKVSTPFATNCNGYHTEHMLLFDEFSSAIYDDGETVRKIWKTIFSIDGKSSNGKIFGGYIKEEKINENEHKIIETCAAIKMSVNHVEEQQITNAVRVLNEIQKIEEQKRVHIIGLIDYGTLKSSSSTSATAEAQSSAELHTYSVLMMELGGISMRERFIQKRKMQIEVNEADMIDDIIMMAQPLKEMHQVAIHLDYHIDNLVFVPINAKPNAKRIVKLIDFDMAQLMASSNCEPRHEIEEEHMADTKCQIHQHSMLNIGKYSSPEQFRMVNKQLSVKTDIWSFGISVYEAILIAKRKYSEKTEIQKILSAIATLHRGFSIEQNGEKLHEINFMNNDWLQFNTEYKVAVKIILRIWKDHPKIAILIMISLQVNSLNRMTAIGIMDFLNDNCKPVQIANSTSVDNLHIFPRLNLSNLGEHIFALIVAQKRCFTCMFIGGKSNLHYLYGKMMKRVGKLLNGLKGKNIEICDTKKVHFLIGSK